MTRRDLLSIFASLPFMGWLKAKPRFNSVQDVIDDERYFKISSEVSCYCLAEFGYTHREPSGWKHRKWCASWAEAEAFIIQMANDEFSHLANLRGHWPVDSGKWPSS